MPVTGDNALATKLVQMKGRANDKSGEVLAAVSSIVIGGLEKLAILVADLDITELQPGQFSIPGHLRPEHGAKAFIGHRSLPIAEGLAAMGLDEDARLVEKLTRAIATAWDVTLPAQRGL